MLKPTIIYVKCCADPFRLFGCILLCSFNFCLLYLFIYENLYFTRMNISGSKTNINGQHIQHDEVGNT